jgi:hypothetical protein
LDVQVFDEEVGAARRAREDEADEGVRGSYAGDVATMRGAPSAPRAVAARRPVDGVGVGVGVGLTAGSFDGGRCFGELGTRAASGSRGADGTCEPLPDASLALAAAAVVRAARRGRAEAAPASCDETSGGASRKAASADN